MRLNQMCKKNVVDLIALDGIMQGINNRLALETMPF